MNDKIDDKITFFEIIVIFITFVLLFSCIYNLFLYSRLNKQRKNSIYANKVYYLINRSLVNREKI